METIVFLWTTVKVIFYSMIALVLGLAILGFVASDMEENRKKKEIKLKEKAQREAENQREKERKLKEKAQESLRNLRIKHINEDIYGSPFRYQVGRHALETLALRYGIPHIENGREATSINITKIKKIEDNKYLCRLPDYRNREVIAIIENGTDYIKTFYPIEGKSWWDKNKSWEDTLKGNTGFTIKDMARMHIDRMNIER